MADVVAWHRKAPSDPTHPPGASRRRAGSTRSNVSLASPLSKKGRSALNKLVKKHGINTAEFRGP